MASDAAEGLTESREHKPKIFISYSRKDVEFADRLEAALNSRGFTPMIDRRDIAKLEEWWERIEALIVQSDTVVFIISPDAVKSSICEKEVTFAQSLNKRLAPILLRQTDTALVPEQLRRINWIDFQDDARFEYYLNDLVGALRTDIKWIRTHTEIGEQARHWDIAGRPGPSGLMLRPPPLDQAEAWIQYRPSGAPEPTEAMRAYITQSRSVFEQEVADRKADIDRFLMAQSRFLVDRSLATYAAGDFVTAMLLALEALPQSDSGSDLVRSRPVIPEAESALIRSLLALLSRQNGSESFSNLYVFSHDATLCLVADGNNATISNAIVTGNQLSEGLRVQLIGHSDTILNASFSRDQALAATASKDATAAIWEVASGKRLFSCTGHTKDVTGVVFAPSNRRLLTISLDGTGRIWSVETGNQLAIFEVNRTTALTSFRGIREIVPSWDAPGRLVRQELIPDPVVVPVNDHFDTGGAAIDLGGDRRCTAFLSPTSEHIASVKGSVLTLWSGTTGAPRHEFELNAIPRFIQYSPDGKLLAASLKDGSVKLIKVESGEIVQADSCARAGPLALSTDGTRLATTADGKIRVWDITDISERGDARTQPVLMCSFGTAKLDIAGLEFSQQDRDMVAVSGCGTQAFVFKVGQERFGTAHGYVAQGWSAPLPDWVMGLKLSPDSRHIVSFSVNNVVHCWQRGSDSPELQYFYYNQFRHEKHDRDDDILDAQFSSDSSKVVIISYGSISIYDLLLRKRITTMPKGGISAAFVISDQFILAVGTSTDKFARLYDAVTGQQVGAFGPDIAPINNSKITTTERHLFVACADKAYLYSNAFSVERLVSVAKLLSPRALTIDHRLSNSLDREIPDWCIETRKYPFFYPEDVLKLPCGYTEMRDCFSTTVIADDIERVVSIVSAGNDDALKIFVEEILAEYSDRIVRNQNRFRSNDDFTLVGESFKEAMSTLTRLGYDNLARILMSEYTGPST
jgi:WD40 repeat protein